MCIKSSPCILYTHTIVSARYSSIKLEIQEEIEQLAALGGGTAGNRVGCVAALRLALNAPETHCLAAVVSFYVCGDMQGFWRKFSLAACFALIILVSSTRKYEGADEVAKLTFSTFYERNA